MFCFLLRLVLIAGKMPLTNLHILTCACAGLLEKAFVYVRDLAVLAYLREYEPQDHAARYAAFKSEYSQDEETLTGASYRILS